MYTKFVKKHDHWLTLPNLADERTTCIRQGFWPPLKPKIEIVLQHSLWIVLLDK